MVGSWRNAVRALNNFVLRTFTMRSLQWRFEAIWSGKSFTEILGERILYWPVKQVLLIHRQSGILLQQVESPYATSQDADMISGMLTAIREFVHDSFTVGHDEGLQSIRAGDLTVRIEQGEQAIVAAIIRGGAPDAFYFNT